MSPRVRATKPSTSSISPSKSKKNRSIEQTSSTIVSTRQKRLSSLTATNLLQYCTNVLSPSRKSKTISKKTSEKQTESHIPIRIRREASSRASAMIMQQNEIERSRYKYSLINEHSNSSSTTKPRPKATTIIKEETPAKTFEFIVPPVPPVTCKYPLLTEAILTEHNRLQESIGTKQDILLKWTQDLASYDRFSPPYAIDDIPPEFPQEEIPILPSVNNSSSLEHTSTRAQISTPNFLFPSNTYSLDLRSFYPLMPYWQYPIWPFQSTIHSKKSFKLDSTARIEKEKAKQLTFHLHTHHHRHIHNSRSSFSPERSTVLVNRNQTRSPLPIDDVSKKEVQPMSPSIENDVLNLSIHQQNNINEGIKNLRRRKSSPVKKHHSVTSPSIVEKATSSGSNPHLRRVLKRRTASATVFSTPSRTSSRGKRTISATARKRSYSPTSISLPLSKTQSRKKQKIEHHWILFGKSEQKLVSIDADRPPVFRQCYSSIQHITEKDVIKSNDCVILRSEPGAKPYLAKVKWFWEEATTGDIQMSLIWYYHPEHTDLPVNIRERFLPNELLASRYWDCVSVACIEDKCYVLNFNEYNRYCLREKSVNLFEHSDAVGQLKFLLNKNTSTIHHRALPAKNVGHQNIFFCRYVYDYRVNRILKNPTLVPTASSM